VRKDGFIFVQTLTFVLHPHRCPFRLPLEVLVVLGFEGPPFQLANHTNFGQIVRIPDIPAESCMPWPRDNCERRANVPLGIERLLAHLSPSDYKLEERGRVLFLSFWHNGAYLQMSGLTVGKVANGLQNGL
jgi:hypothetical protein